MKNELKLYSWLLVLAMLFWGGGWTALKILTNSASLEVIVFWRFFLMSVAFLPILYFFKEPIRISKHSLGFILGSCIFNIAFMVSSYYGISYGLAGAGSVIITSLAPIMTFIITLIFFKHTTTKMQFFGLFLGLVAAAIMLELNDFALFTHKANLFFILCATIWAGVTILSQHSHKYIHPIHYSFFISLVATISAFFYGFHTNLLAVFSQKWEFWVALVYLAVFGQTVATTIFFMASGKLGSQKTSSFMFLVPIFALFTAWLVLNEALQMHIIIGGSLSMLAVYFINKK